MGIGGVGEAFTWSVCCILNGGVHQDLLGQHRHIISVQMSTDDNSSPPESSNTFPSQPDAVMTQPYVLSISNATPARFHRPQNPRCIFAPSVVSQLPHPPRRFRRHCTRQTPTPLHNGLLDRLRRPIIPMDIIPYPRINLIHMIG